MIIHNRFQHIFIIIVSVICIITPISAMKRNTKDELQCTTLQKKQKISEPLSIVPFSAQQEKQISEIKIKRAKKQTQINELEKLILHKIHPEQSFKHPHTFGDTTIKPKAVFSPDGNYYCESIHFVEDKIGVIHIPTGKRNFIRINPNTTLYNTDKTLKVPATIAFLKCNNSYLISGIQYKTNECPTLAVWNINTNKQLTHTIRNSLLKYAQSVDWNPKKDNFVSAAQDVICEHYIIKEMNNFSTNELYDHKNVTRVKYSPNGKKIVSVGNGVIILYCTANRDACIFRIGSETAHNIQQISWHPTTNNCAVTSSVTSGCNIIIFDGIAKKVLYAAKDICDTTSILTQRDVQFSPNGEYLITVNIHEDEAQNCITIRTGNPEDNKSFDIITSFNVPINSTKAVTFSNNGKYLIFATENSIYFYDLESRTMITNISTLKNIPEVILCRPRSNQFLYIEKTTGSINPVNIFSPQTELAFQELVKINTDWMNFIEYICAQSCSSGKIPNGEELELMFNKLPLNIKTTLIRMFPNHISTSINSCINE